MDVFLRWYPQSEFREHLANAVWQRLLAIKTIRLMRFERGLKDYHIQSKRLAEFSAQSDIYCVIDDDQLPIYPDFFERGREALANHPEYGMVAGYSLIEHAQVPRSADVVEMHAIGCPYFVRKGTLTFPEGPKEQYDGILSKVVTDQGLKTGIATKCPYNHLGHGFSQVIPGHNALDGD